MKRTRISAAALLGLSWLLFAYGQVPLPVDLVVVPPAPEIPAKLAAYSGAWGGGAWGGTLPSMVVVERIAATGEASVVYAWGTDPLAKIKAGWTRSVATFAEGKLHVFHAPELVVDFELGTDGRLQGYYRRDVGAPAMEILTRCGTADKNDILEMAQKPIVPLWKEIRIPEPTAAGGDSITLQATLYPFSEPGRRPVIVYNHGSTGNGRVSATAVTRAFNEALTFQQLGFVVVVPMRKGRGSSGGKFIEEQLGSPAETQLAAALEDLEATVDYLRAQPYVDAKRIVVAGQSRGGFLAVVYAGLHPEKVAGAINFSGGWWGERAEDSVFNLSQMDVAGRRARSPMLWLYAEHDSYYSLAYSEQMFARFRASGGQGRLFEARELAGDGHFLSSWPEKWRTAVENYLVELSRPETQLVR